jgi:uncharacterized protein YbjT (DUF2867 family)
MSSESEDANDASRVAVLAGASGLVGRELSLLLAQSERYSKVYSLVRRATPDHAPHDKLSERLVSFDALPALPSCDDVYVALGTTIKQAGSEAAFRRVDYDHVLAVATAGRAAGAKRLGVVSALGADAGSRVFYNRVKGEMERSVMALGYECVVIAQPSLLIGDREALGQPTRSAEVLARGLLGPVSWLIPASFRPVQVRDVAASLVARVLRDERGGVILPSREMHGAALS